MFGVIMAIIEKKTKEGVDKISALFESLEKDFGEKIPGYTISELRGRPLLVMFYSESAGQIMPYDIKALEQIFEDFLKEKNKKGFKEIDLLIHTHGGEAHTAYRLIQLIRSYCNHLNVLVSTHAHSGGTLIAFGSDVVEMGRSATLSPIDVQIGRGKEGRFGLLSIEKYIDFLEDACKRYSFKNEENKAHFVTELTKELVEEVCPSRLGELFRLRSLTELHAKTLLYDYMFKNSSEKEELANEIIAKFTKESPTHEFVMDYELVKQSSLRVKRMDEKIYKLSTNLIDILTQLKRAGAICDFYGDSTDKRKPFFKIFDSQKGDKKDDRKN